MLGSGNVASLAECTSLCVCVGPMWTCYVVLLVARFLSPEGALGCGWNKINHSAASRPTVLGSNLRGVGGLGWSPLAQVFSPKFVSGVLDPLSIILRWSDPLMLWWPSPMRCVCAYLEGPVVSNYSSPYEDLGMTAMTRCLIACS